MIEALFSNPNYAAAKKVLDAAEMRHEAIARNLANIETPQYKRVDVALDFDAELKKAVATRDSRVISGVTPRLTVDTEARASGKDGNTVQLEGELTRLTENAMNHQMGTHLATGQLLRLRMAITGRAV
jgi:flagellar basal-body rod protein FlgB